MAAWRLTGVLAMLAVGLWGCSTDGMVLSDPRSEQVTRGDVFDELDSDGDGVVLRSDYELTALVSDRARAAATLEGHDLSIGAVLDSLAESPVSQAPDSATPARDEIIARLTSMLQLRLVGLALDSYGFAVDIDADDGIIDAQIQQHLVGPFEEFARWRLPEQDPDLAASASPHCVSLLTAPTQAEAAAAAARVAAGTPIAQVASEINLPATTAPDGSVGCELLSVWLTSAGALGEIVAGLAEGELSDPFSVPYQNSPTGELWIVLALTDIRLDQVDLNTLLLSAIPAFAVAVAPEIGVWDPSAYVVGRPVSDAQAVGAPDPSVPRT